MKLNHKDTQAHINPLPQLALSWIFHVCQIWRKEKKNDSKNARIVSYMKKYIEYLYIKVELPDIYDAISVNLMAETSNFKTGQTYQALIRNSKDIHLACQKKKWIKSERERARRLSFS